MTQPAPFAAPSCVLPATVAENARFLAGRVAEVGLCLFEAEACLAYGLDDLPGALTELPLRWHVHLPVDLPWEAGGGAASALALAVLHKVSYLNPRLAVLHPPAPLATPASPAASTALAALARHAQTQARLLEEFRTAWFKHSKLPVLLENIDVCDLVALPPTLMEGDDSFGVCLDIGHALAFGHTDLLENARLLDKIRLVHWSAPGAHDQHLPLTRWTTEQRAVAENLARRLPHDATHMAEIFHWAGVEASLPVLKQLLES